MAIEERNLVGYRCSDCHSVMALPWVPFARACPACSKRNLEKIVIPHPGDRISVQSVNMLPVSECYGSPAQRSHMASWLPETEALATVVSEPWASRLGNSWKVGISYRVIPDMAGSKVYDLHFSQFEVVNTGPHTPECRANYEQWGSLVLIYTIAHEHFCHKCQGWGGSESQYDPSPAGISLGSGGTMTDVELCDECTENGRCARCGRQILNEKELNAGKEIGVCPFCGFEYGDSGYPVIPECYCWEDEALISAGLDVQCFPVTRLDTEWKNKIESAARFFFQEVPLFVQRNEDEPA